MWKVRCAFPIEASSCSCFIWWHFFNWSNRSSALICIFSRLRGLECRRGNSSKWNMSLYPSKGCFLPFVSREMKITRVNKSCVSVFNTRFCREHFVQSITLGSNDKEFQLHSQLPHDLTSLLSIRFLCLFSVRTDIFQLNSLSFWALALVSFIKCPGDLKHRNASLKRSISFKKWQMEK